MTANGLSIGASTPVTVLQPPVHTEGHVDRGPDMALTSIANVVPVMSLARAQERLAEAVDRELRSVLAEKNGTDNDTPFGRTQRAAIALQRTLYWLCLRHPDEALRKDLVIMATMLVACVKAQRLPDPVEMTQWDHCFEGMRAQSDIRQDVALCTTYDVGDILRNIQTCSPLVDKLETRGVWTRIGQLVTMLWSYGPFDEGSTGDPIKQVAREALTSLVHCSRQHELVGWVTESLKSFRGGDARFSALEQDFHLAGVLVDDRHPMERLGWARVFKDDSGFWRPWQ